MTPTAESPPPAATPVVAFVEAPGSRADQIERLLTNLPRGGPSRLALIAAFLAANPLGRD